MENDCVILKRKDYDELLKPIEEQRKKIENDIKKEFRENEQKLYDQISNLKQQINNTNPVIDPMKMIINLTYASAKKRHSGCMYGSYEYYDIEIAPHVNIKEINVDLKGGIYQQVRRIISETSKKIVSDTFEKLKEYHTEAMVKELADAENKGRLDEKRKIQKLSFFKRIDYLSDIEIK